VKFALFNFLSLFIHCGIVLYYVEEAIANIESGSIASSASSHEDNVLRKLLKIDKKAAVVMVSDMLLGNWEYLIDDDIFSELILIYSLSLLLQLESTQWVFASWTMQITFKFNFLQTATATINTLYCLAKNPEKQEILRQELIKTMPSSGTQLKAENMKNMPFLRGVIKETFRVMPVISGTARKLTNDVNLSGYNVPSGTHVIMVPTFETADEIQYPQPHKFIPERWLRDNNDPQCPHAKNANPFTFLPFGFGSRSVEWMNCFVECDGHAFNYRMCIGRRLAELEMEVLVANVIRNYRLEWHHPDMKIKSTFINIPVSELKFKMIDV
jgi:cytochrome P450 family 12